MLESVLGPIAQWIINLISQIGYWGIILAMAIESACIPLPSEIIMPFSGYLVSTGRFSLWGASLAGAFGCLIGSTVAYWVGVWGGRPFLSKYGKYILISHKDMDISDKWFAKYGDWAIFFSRLLPIVRTFISFPAGIARMNFVKFAIYTFLGSLPWCLALAYVGKILGENWDKIRVYFHKADLFIGILLLAAIIFFIYRHIKK